MRHPAAFLALGPGSITLHHHAELFSIAILGFCLRSDLANHAVACLYKSLHILQSIPEVAQKRRVRADKRNTCTVKSLELC